MRSQSVFYRAIHWWLAFQMLLQPALPTLSIARLPASLFGDARTASEPHLAPPLDMPAPASENGAHTAAAAAETPPATAFTCPQPEDYWRNQPDAWPVSALALGSQTYDQAELLNLLDLPATQDASLALAHRLIASRLNVAAGSDPAPVDDLINDANVLLSGFEGRLPYQVKPSSQTGKQMLDLADELERYNTGELTPDCELAATPPPTDTPTPDPTDDAPPTDTPTPAPTETPTPEDAPAQPPTPKATPDPETCALYPIALSAETLAGVGVGDTLPDILNGTQPGGFGWLTWTGSPGTPTLVTSLTPPGDSATYVNPDDPADTTLSVGDWIQGRPGVANSGQVREALDTLKTLDIAVPIWDSVREEGNNSAYRVLAFARVRLLDYQLAGENRISARFLGYTCEGGVIAPDKTVESASLPPLLDLTLSVDQEDAIPGDVLTYSTTVTNTETIPFWGLSGQGHLGLGRQQAGIPS